MTLERFFAVISNTIGQFYSTYMAFISRLTGMDVKFICVYFPDFRDKDRHFDWFFLRILILIGGFGSSLSVQNVALLLLFHCIIIVLVRVLAFCRNKDVWSW